MPVCVCVRTCVCKERTYLWMSDGKCVHPNPPASPLILNSMVEKDPEYGVNHFSNFLLLAVLRRNEAQGQHPVLPYRALQQTPNTAHKKSEQKCWTQNLNERSVFFIFSFCQKRKENIKHKYFSVKYIFYLTWYNQSNTCMTKQPLTEM